MKPRLFFVYLMLCFLAVQAQAQERRDGFRAFPGFFAGFQSQFGPEEYPRLSLGFSGYYSKGMFFVQGGYNRLYTVNQISVGYGWRVTGPFDVDLYLGPAAGCIDYGLREGLDEEWEGSGHEEHSDAGLIPFFGGLNLRIDSPRLGGGVAYASVDLFFNEVFISGLKPWSEIGIRVHGAVALVKAPSRPRK